MYIYYNIKHFVFATVNVLPVAIAGQSLNRLYVFFVLGEQLSKCYVGAILLSLYYSHYVAEASMRICENSNIFIVCYVAVIVVV